MLEITVTSAQNAAALNRLMESMNFTDPYILLTAPPTDGGKLRRHLHPHDEFKSLDDGSAT